MFLVLGNKGVENIVAAVIAASVNGHGSFSSLEPQQQDNPIQKSNKYIKN
jgi:hypothetical protein